MSGIPDDSRAARDQYLKKSSLTEERMVQIKNLNEIANSRGQSLAQMALSWTLNNEAVSSVIIGASRPSQIVECVGALANLDFPAKDLQAIDQLST